MFLFLGRLGMGVGVGAEGRQFPAELADLVPPGGLSAHGFSWFCGWLRIWFCIVSAISIFSWVVRGGGADEVRSTWGRYFSMSPVSMLRTLFPACAIRTF